MKSSRVVQSLMVEATHEFGALQRITFTRDELDLGSEKKIVKRPDPVHGFVFQLKLLMLFLHRGVSLQYSFLLGTEIKEAKKFDDLVFEYEKDGKRIFRLLQAKHKLDKTKCKITEESLLTDSDGDFSLPKYFFSYRSAKKEKLFNLGGIKDITICTNINFSDGILTGNNIKLEKIDKNDDILDIKIDNEVRPVRYRVKEDIIPLLKPKLNEYIVQSKRTSPKYTDRDIKEFLNCLVFAVNCPSEEELGEIIKADIGKAFDSVTTKNVYNHFFVTMLDWMQGKQRGRFLSYKEGKMFFEEAVKGVPIWYNVRNPVESFAGRSKELDILHNLLQRNDPGSQSVCIVGLGGVGKSELVSKYVRDHCHKYDNRVIWINAENYRTLKDSFHKLATEELSLSTRNADGAIKNISCVVNDVYRFFSKGKCLFIFDNASYYRTKEEFDDSLSRFLPCIDLDSITPYILITSRNQKWPRSISVLKLDVLQEVEAVELISKTLETKTDDFKILARELQYFPLALQQAVAYIRVQDNKLRYLGLEFNVNKYIKRFKEKTKLMLNFQFPEDCDNPYSKTVFVTWDVSLEAISEKENGDDAIEIFRILSYMCPEDIPTEPFLVLVCDEDGLVTAFDLLKQYSMITLEGTLINVHRLVQQITRIKLKEENKEVEFIEKALKLLSENKLNSRNLNHAISIWNFSRKHEELLKKFCWISPSISSHLIKSGRYEEAHVFGLKAAESLSAVQSHNSQSVLQSILNTKSDVGVALQSMGEHEKALTTYLELIPHYLSSYGLKHPSTLTVKSNIASVIHGQGRYSEALKLHQEVLDLRIAILGEKHPHTLVTKRNIAKIYFLKGSLNESFKMLQELYEIQESILGPKHSDTLETRVDIAITARHMGNYSECLQILQDIHNIQETNLGKKHPKFLHTKCCIGATLIDFRKSTEAMNIFQEVLTTRKIVLGENHPDVLKTLFYMANILMEQCNYHAALKVFEEIYGKQIKLKGLYHPDSMDTQYSIGNTLYYLGKYNDALQTYQEVLAKRIATSGCSHRNTLRVKNGIAGIYFEVGEYDKALQLYMELLELQRSGPEDNLEILDTKHGLGRTLVCKQEFDQAFTIFQEILEELQNEMIPPEHPHVFCAKLSLADVLSIQNKHDEAKEICKQVLETQVTILGNDHLDTAETKCIFGNVLLRGKRPEEALRVLKEASPIFDNVFGPEHPKTKKLNNIINSITSTKH